jgi:hypothetical protein
MTQEELGITDTGMRYIKAILARADLIEQQAWERRFMRGDADLSPMIKARERVEAEVEYWRSQSRREMGFED